MYTLQVNQQLTQAFPTTSPLRRCVYYRVYRKKAAKSLGVCQGGIATRSTSMG